MNMYNTLWGVNLGSSWGCFVFIPFLHTRFVWPGRCGEGCSGWRGAAHGPASPCPLWNEGLENCNCEGVLSGPAFTHVVFTFELITYVLLMVLCSYFYRYSL